MEDTILRRTWAEIDLDALAHNYRQARKRTGPNVKYLGVVKADAYGHGALQVAKKLEELGTDYLAVSSLDEARELRHGGVNAPILILGHTPPEMVPQLIAYGITQAVSAKAKAEEYSAAAAACGGTLKVHIKVDTGMSRLGFLWRKGEDNGQLLEDIAALCTLPGLEAEGMFTHFADADGSEEYTMDQLTRFLDAKEALEKRGVTFGIYHCGASAAVLNYPCTHMNMIRPGIALYGYYPDPAMEGLDGSGLEPVMTVKSRVCAIRRVPAGTSVSYGRTAVLERDSRLAVVPTGYGDGYPRALSNRMVMRIRGKDCPIVGRVCMDMCMVDVTDLPEAAVGDTAVVYGPELTERAASLTGTIVYELLCDVAPRVPRIYLESGAGNR